MAFVAAATIGIGICVTVFAAPVLALGAVGTAVAGIVGEQFVLTLYSYRFGIYWCRCFQYVDCDEQQC